jgi:hypothetical protein
MQERDTETQKCTLAHCGRLDAHGTGETRPGYSNNQQLMRDGNNTLGCLVQVIVISARILLICTGRVPQHPPTTFAPP